jgi:hypothetical protein
VKEHFLSLKRNIYTGKTCDPVRPHSLNLNNPKLFPGLMIGLRRNALLISENSIMI